MVKNQTDTLERVINFLRLDWTDWRQGPFQTASKEEVLKLQRSNERKPKYPGKVEGLPLDVCKALAKVYIPHNKRLYKFLASRATPPEQPPFPPFEDPCISDSKEGAKIIKRDSDGKDQGEDHATGYDSGDER
eukprot:CAMPEP_0181345396 /NCGR_PEP_ID=MMETSP1101-20121128/32724_1 /TAXON_ID=46948 /ORGANISM="Rhodomonas abbreviata, Strain Caron Lab Isolate" /LENGTH=132 /DNA_ID=CAMNT_0023457343 /DNA_START=291 /DNA_END=689 /DNA_ORIENTATION=-